MTKHFRYKIVESRQTDYTDPIIFKKGEIVTVGREYQDKEIWRRLHSY